MSGVEEYLPSYLSPPLDNDVWITARGTLIMVFDPEKQKTVWEWTDEKEYGNTRVSKGFRVKVLHGWVRMSTSAPA